MQETLCIACIWFCGGSRSGSGVLTSRHSALETWVALYATVDGRLIATSPLVSPWHDPNYDAAKCDPLQEDWDVNLPTSIDAPYFQNQSCDPFTPQSSPCRIGNYLVYAIKVTKASNAAAGLDFAKRNNVRLVIKNTGHDLSLWRDNLKDISIRHYSSSYYMEKAMRMGAGVQACEAHGLGADQVLEWEPEKNKDLYWALSGGGAGTYGVVLSMAVKAHTDTRITGAMISLTQQGAEQAFWNGVTAFHAELPSYTKGGATVGYIIAQGQMSIQPVTFPGKSKADVENTMVPLKKKLDALGTLYQIDIREFSNYSSFFDYYYGPLTSGRLIPREVVTNNASSQAFTDVLEEISLDPNFVIIAMALGAYMNEGNFEEPDFQTQFFFGTN
ncbi:hypothetical protein DM02DRAFT_639399 [Periconia macrospinosa]|uniref:FAD-binding domain-containing protein n=1 Tax=Periconia macrospinosa TaxID=97972 RepID=A0A2V1E4G8_9PLEO|nr:hypothetical protein DM02DRAFT_639399 [Periconia macrospinosa]